MVLKLRPSSRRILGPLSNQHRCPREAIQVYVIPPLTDPLVRLEVDNAPIREAVAKLTATCPVDVQVYPEIPQDVRVTAHVYMMPLTEFLSNLATQSHVAVTFDALDTEGRVIDPKSWGWGPAIREEPSGTMPVQRPAKERYYLIPYSSLQVRDKLRGLLVDEHAFSVQSPGGADLTVDDVSFAEAMAKLAEASGKDIVVDPAVPSTLRVTAHVYRQPPDYLMDLMTQNTGLEKRKTWVDATGAACAPGHSRATTPR